MASSLFLEFKVTTVSSHFVVSFVPTKMNWLCAQLYARNSAWCADVSQQSDLEMLYVIEVNFELQAYLQNQYIPIYSTSASWFWMHTRLAVVKHHGPARFGPW